MSGGNWSRFCGERPRQRGSEGTQGRVVIVYWLWRVTLGANQFRRWLRRCMNPEVAPACRLSQLLDYDAALAVGESRQITFCQTWYMTGSSQPVIIDAFSSTMSPVSVNTTLLKPIITAAAVYGAEIHLQSHRLIYMGCCDVIISITSMLIALRRHVYLWV